LTTKLGYPVQGGCADIQCHSWRYPQCRTARLIRRHCDYPTVKLSAMSVATPSRLLRYTSRTVCLTTLSLHPTFR